MNTELTWYEYEASKAGKNEWFSTNLHADSVLSLKAIPLWKSAYNDIKEYDLRIVRKTLTTEVIA